MSKATRSPTLLLHGRVRTRIHPMMLGSGNNAATYARLFFVRLSIVVASKIVATANKKRLLIEERIARKLGRTLNHARHAAQQCCLKHCEPEAVNNHGGLACDLCGWGESEWLCWAAEEIRTALGMPLKHKNISWAGKYIQRSLVLAYHMQALESKNVRRRVR